MKILIVCEKLADRDDEGIKNVARHLLQTFAMRHEVRALSREPWGGRENVTSVPMGRFFLNPGLLRAAHTFRPDLTLYIPWTSGTPPTFFRAAMLGVATRSPVGLILCQPYPLPAAALPLVRLLLPPMVFGMGDGVLRQLAALGGRTAFLPAGVDLSRFTLPTQAQRLAEREKLDIGDADQVVLHVGHLNRRRMDAEEILSLARRPGRSVVIVCSPATPQDEGLRSSFTQAGIRIISEFLPQIERIYWAADAYLFPTRDARNCIGVPLSVLEALASGLSVVATPFEGLPRLFPATPCVQFASSLEEIETDLARVPAPGSPEARKLVEPLAWDRVAEDLLTAMQT